MSKQGEDRAWATPEEIRKIMKLVDMHVHPTKKSNGELLVTFREPINPTIEALIQRHYAGTVFAGDKTLAVISAGSATAFGEAFTQHIENERGQSWWGAL